MSIPHPSPPGSLTDKISSVTHSMGSTADMAASPRLLLLLSILQYFIQCVQANYRCEAQYNRFPDNRDISIDCGTHLITVSVNLCPSFFAGFDPLTLALNGRYNDTNCKGSMDVSATPPVIRYSIIVKDINFNNCGNNFKILDEGPGSGTFAHFSNLQSILISGIINPPNNRTLMISYNPRLYYKFSCKYPLEYILNNTRLVTSSISIAVATSNGSFSSTLALNLYDDQDYTSPLIIPDTGLPLKYKVYVEVSISNLTANFNVLLDHCFATPSPLNLSLLDTGYTFFTGCNISPRTIIIRNGVSKKSWFVFDTFRFNRKLSTIYVHCIARLCEAKTCQTLLQALPCRGALALIGRELRGRTGCAQAGIGFGRGSKHPPIASSRVTLHPANLYGNRAPGMGAPRNTNQFLMHEKYQLMHMRSDSTGSDSGSEIELDIDMDSYLGVLENARGGLDCTTSPLGDDHLPFEFFKSVDQDQSVQYFPSEDDVVKSERFMRQDFAAFC
ncbi:zona pellucida-like domain-containing protein 1 [Narcine bancroftii]|uniref:zona pellucida-like domain-containing protein 1 n=1 Tax=Narcine bancroftii TaxID=1343680 RepID=UPI003831D08D